RRSCAAKAGRSARRAAASDRRRARSKGAKGRGAKRHSQDPGVGGMRLPVMARAALLCALVAACLTLPAAAQTSEESPALQTQWAIAAGSAGKIEGKKDGWSRGRRSLPVRSGADLVAPGRLRLYADGEEIPMLVGRSGIEFYGQAVDTPSTGTHTYWLVRGAPGGRRIPVVSAGRARRSGFARSFQFPLEQKYRTLY